MERYGLIPVEFGGGPKYRIIWAPSRMVTLVGQEKTITVPMYCGPLALEPVGECWILEGWKSPADLYAGTEEQWNTDPMMLNTGPYPRRGDYVLHEALSCNPAQASIEKLILWIEAGGKRRPIENAQFCQDALQRDMRDRKSKRDALIRDSMRPFGMEAFVGYGGQRATKTLPGLKSREELGLPAEGVTKAMRVRRPAVYEVMTE